MFLRGVIGVFLGCGVMMGDTRGCKSISSVGFVTVGGVVSIMLTVASSAG